MRKQAKCHPDRLHKGNGLCTSCYAKQKYAANPEKFRKRAKIYRTNNIDIVKERQKDRHKRITYGITLEEFKQQCAKLDYKCELCGQICIKTMHVDHNHETGVMRGLLCNNCNRNLGWVENRLNRLKNYIEKYNIEPRDKME